MANEYTHGHHESVLRSHTWRTIENSASYLAPHLVPGVSVLDVGCGPGTITAEIADRVTPGLVTAIDNAPEVVERARSDAGASRTNLTIMVADVFDLDFPPNSFDIVHAHQVLQHVDDPVGALRAMRTVVATDGIVAVRDADYGAMRWFPELEVLDEWLRIYSAVARSNNAEPDAGRFMRAWAHTAGFASVEATVDAWCFATPEECAWWGSLWADRTQASSFGEQAIDRGFATPGELADIAAGWREWMQHPDAWFVVPNTELLLRG